MPVDGTDAGLGSRLATWRENVRRCSACAECDRFAATSARNPRPSRRRQGSDGQGCPSLADSPLRPHTHGTTSKLEQRRAIRPSPSARELLCSPGRAARQLSLVPGQLGSQSASPASFSQRLPGEGSWIIGR